MNIVVLDGYTLNPGDLSWASLEAIGDCKIYDRTPGNMILERVKGADIVFTNKTPLSKEIFQTCSTIKYVGVLATGYNVVDIQAAKEKNVVVTNIPTYGTDAVSQFAIGLLLELCHHIGEHSDAVKAGEWSSNPDWCFWKYPLVELAGKNLGIIGYGRIGQGTGRIAQALGMNVLAYDAYKKTELENEHCRYVELDELLSASDAIALHCPLFPETEGIINKENISKMKDGVFIINNSRGPLVVEEDLAEALCSGKVGGAALDVVSSEPIVKDNPLLKTPNTIITPHISWAPQESRQRLFNIAIDNLKHFLQNDIVNAVN